MSKHTPGPWKVWDGFYPGIEGPNDRSVIIFGDKNENSGVHGGEPEESYSEEREANAHLIAAAPDLLEVCQTFPGFNNLSHNPDAIANWVVKLNEAIAKATNQKEVEP